MAAEEIKRFSGSAREIRIDYWRLMTSYCFVHRYVFLYFACLDYMFGLIVITWTWIVMVHCDKIKIFLFNIIVCTSVGV